MESRGSRCRSGNVLIRATAVPVSKDLPGAREYASNGLFGLRFMGGPWFLQGCLLRQRGEAGASGVRSTLGKEVTPGNRKKELLLLFLERGNGGRRVKRPRETAIWSRLCTFAIPQSSLARRSSSHPCGTGLESPNLSAALPNVVTYGGSRPHIAPVVRTVYMPCSS